MKKIGRNDPCPCGSGKKYKRCCLDPWERLQHFLDIVPHFADVNQMTTEEIILRLEDAGIGFEREKFLQEVEVFYSAEQIWDNWYETFEIKLYGWEEEFPWLAAWVLWERMTPPHNLPREQISVLYEQANAYLGSKDYKNASEIFLKAWEAIRYKNKPEYKDMSFLDEQYSSNFFISNLVQDIELSLRNAATRDPVYSEKLIVYCREFVQMFPGEDESIVHNMRRAIAEAYSRLGDYERANLEFQKIVEDYPHNLWGYIGWGDIYFLDKNADFAKAKELYLKALAITKDEFDIMVVQERLEDLEQAKLSRGQQTV